MQTIAGRLSEEELAALAAYFGSLGLPLKTP
jgi:cytochrome c553